MSEQFRDVSPEDADLQPIIDGLFGEYAARYGDYFSKDAEVELTEWYLAPQGLFIVLERDGEIIATGAYKPFDEHTAEIKRIWTHKALRQQGLAARVVQERPEVTTYTLRLPKTTASFKSEVEASASKYLDGKTLRTCPR